MNLTERLTPGDRASAKPSPGLDMLEIGGPVSALPPEINARAMRRVAGLASDARDARVLLEHLGLVNPLTPSPAWRRANSPKAAP